MRFVWRGRDGTSPHPHGQLLKHEMTGEAGDHKDQEQGGLGAYDGNFQLRRDPEYHTPVPMTAFLDHSPPNPHRIPGIPRCGMSLGGHELSWLGLRQHPVAEVGVMSLW